MNLLSFNSPSIHPSGLVSSWNNGGILVAISFVTSSSRLNLGAPFLSILWLLARQLLLNELYGSFRQPTNHPAANPPSLSTARLPFWTEVRLNKNVNFFANNINGKLLKFTTTNHKKFYVLKPRAQFSFSFYISGHSKLPFFHQIQVSFFNPDAFKYIKKTSFWSCTWDGCSTRQLVSLEKKLLNGKN